MLLNSALGSGKMSDGDLFFFIIVIIIFRCVVVWIAIEFLYNTTTKTENEKCFGRGPREGNCAKSSSGSVRFMTGWRHPARNATRSFV